MTGDFLSIGVSGINFSFLECASPRAKMQYHMGYV
jgi:hypothetical protein